MSLDATAEPRHSTSSPDPPAAHGRSALELGLDRFDWVDYVGAIDDDVPAAGPTLVRAGIPTVEDAVMSLSGGWRHVAL